MNLTAFATLVAGVIVVAPAVARAQAGNPNSCYGKCGFTPTSQPPGVSLPMNCYCDAACNAFADCCRDKHDYCAADPAAARQFSPGAGQPMQSFPTAAAPICALTGNVVPNAPRIYPGVCGTDLGFIFPHNDSTKLEIMFGDTSTGAPCFDWGALLQSDDLQAQLPSAKPPWVPTSLSASANPQSAFGTNCPNTLLTIDQPNSLSFTPVRLFSALGEIPLYLGGTPLAGFSDGRTAYALFGVSTADGNDYPVYLAYRDQGTSVTSRTTYRIAKTLTTHFTSPTVARVKAFAASDPTQALSNYDTPAGGELGGAVFIWGRPRYGSPMWKDAFGNCPGPLEDPNTNGLYLMRQSLPLRSTLSLPYTVPSWNDNLYYKATDAKGLPIWGTAAEAKPIIGSDFRYTEYLDIKWIKAIGKWVMLYGGDESDGLTCPIANDQPRRAAIHMRMADRPWGPWSPATPVLWREEIPWYFHCDANASTNPQGCDTSVFNDHGSWRPDLPNYFEANCRTDPTSVEPPQPNTCLGNPHQRGLMYAPNMLPTWTVGGAFNQTTRYTTAVVYFVVSTWVPYQVVLSAMVLQLPSYAYTSSGVRLQIRDNQDHLITANSVTTLETHAGGTLGGPTALTIMHMNSAQQGPIRIGDPISIRAVAGGKYLARTSTTDVAWVDTLTDAGRWIIESNDATAFPNGTPVVPEVTPFRLASYTSSARLKSAAGLHIDAAVSSASQWKFSWSCHAGDQCMR